MNKQRRVAAVLAALLGEFQVGDIVMQKRGPHHFRYRVLYVSPRKLLKLRLIDSLNTVYSSVPSSLMTIYKGKTK